MAVLLPALALSKVPTALAVTVSLPTVPLKVPTVRVALVLAS